LGNADVPQQPDDSPLTNAVLRFHAALFRAEDALSRCRDSCGHAEVTQMSRSYGDEQLMLAMHACEQARVALKLIQREIDVKEALELGHKNNGMLPGFHDSNAYEGDRL